MSAHLSFLRNFNQTYVTKKDKKFKLKIIIKLKLFECLKVLNVFIREKIPNRDVCPNAT